MSTCPFAARSTSSWTRYVLTDHPDASRQHASRVVRRERAHFGLGGRISRVSDRVTRRILASRAVPDEALALSAEILRNLELNEIPLSQAALKALRLARLLNHEDVAALLNYEVSGYPTSNARMPPDAWQHAIRAGRSFQIGTSSYAYQESIAAIEQTVRLGEAAISAAGSILGWETIAGVQKLAVYLHVG